MEKFRKYSIVFMLIIARAVCVGGAGGGGGGRGSAVHESYKLSLETKCRQILKKFLCLWKGAFIREGAFIRINMVFGKLTRLIPSRPFRTPKQKSWML